MIEIHSLVENPVSPNLKEIGPRKMKFAENLFNLSWGFVNNLWITCGHFLSAVWPLILTAPIHCRGFIGEQMMQC